MKITLYEHCCLNNTYTEVFALNPKNSNPNSIPFLLYLETLSKRVIDIESTYMELSGTLIFDYKIMSDVNIYSYNYMKVEFTFGDNLTTISRFCFIKDIIVKNELVYLSYEEDIWHSYADKIVGINPSILCSSRLVKEYDNTNNFEIISASMKMDYDTYNGVQITPIRNVNNWTVIVELQNFNLDSAGKNTKREFAYVVLQIWDNEHESGDFEIDDLEIINDLVKNCVDGTYQFCKGTSLNNRQYYEIGNIYVFPTYFNLTNTDHLYGCIAKNLGHDVWTPIIKCYDLDVVDLTTVATFEVPLNYKLKEIGTLHSRLEVNYNKLAQNSYGIIQYVANKYGISVLFQFQGQFVDITDDFLLRYPVDYIGAAEFKQQKIAVALQKAFAGMNIFTNLMGMNASWASTLNNNIQAIGNFGGTAMDYSQTAESSGAAGEAGMYIALAKMLGKVNANTMNYMYETVKYGENIFKDAMIFLKLNAKAYGTNKGLLNSPNTTVYNIYNGIIAFTKLTRNNKDPRSIINNYGYSVLKIIDNNNFENLKIHDAEFYQSKDVPINYNFIQFSEISLYGDFTNKIAGALNNMFLHGIKIWYNENRTEDNLQVG